MILYEGRSLIPNAYMYVRVRASQTKLLSRAESLLLNLILTWQLRRV